jgi:hypothetical protein
VFGILAPHAVSVGFSGNGNESVTELPGGLTLTPSGMKIWMVSGNTERDHTKLVISCFHINYATIILITEQVKLLDACSVPYNKQRTHHDGHPLRIPRLRTNG